MKMKAVLDVTGEKTRKPCVVAARSGSDWETALGTDAGRGVGGRAAARIDEKRATDLLVPSLTHSHPISGATHSSDKIYLYGCTGWARARIVPIYMTIIYYYV